MNNEIKEILHEMKQMCDVWVKVDGNMKSYNQDQIHKIYDYITNLQQENNNLKTSLDESQEVVIDLQQKNERLKKQLEYLRTDEYLNQVKWERNFNETMNKELRQRIEKAVEYIKVECMCNYGLDDTYMEKLLNILN